MAHFCSSWFSHFLVVVVSFVVATNVFYCGASNDDRKVHIVYLGSLREGEYSVSAQQNSLLQDVLDSSSVSDTLVRSYKRSFNGFAAKLTAEESEKLARRSEVVSIFPSRTLQLQTTRSWDFMGFSDSIPRNLKVENDLVVGVIDSGIWPDSESFSGSDFSPPPQKWKGVCDGGKNFTCNNKLIGARYYGENDHSAMDKDGHGTHTASTAAGNTAQHASYFGVAEGTARGAVPSSRIAMYKVCDEFGCQESDILAAFDDAISDGVDILTVSLGPDEPMDITVDTIAIGAFHAMQRGILTMQSAGNSGFQRSSLSSVSPWLFTVAASNTDRRIVDTVVLGNGKKFIGNAVNAFMLNGTSFPLISGKDAARKTGECNPALAESCISECVDSELVKGKILVCTSFTGIQEAFTSGALGVIVPSTREDVSFVVPFPTAILQEADFHEVYSYINSTTDPQGTIWKSEDLKVTSAPVVASFSSRGPNSIIPEILKPDISAPGVDILAAYSIFATASPYSGDRRVAKFNVLSGTSMSCPHVAGVAAYVKTFHPDWSPSAIKSAIMTTAWPMNTTEQSDYEFAYGSGHINPVKAADPGLVYETTKDDYIKMLCNMGYNETNIRRISGDKNSTCPKGNGSSSPKDLNYPSMSASLNSTAAFSVKFTRTVTNVDMGYNETNIRRISGDKNSTCPKGNGSSSPKDLNYPSMSASLNSTAAFSVKFSRTVTNVGSANSVYKSKVTTITSASDVKIVVEPTTLSFKSIGETKTFVVTVSGKIGVMSIFSGSLVWDDSTHSVRSPIVVYS